jgi:hypothetical protein
LRRWLAFLRPEPDNRTVETPETRYALSGDVDIAYLKGVPGEWRLFAVGDS